MQKIDAMMPGASIQVLGTLTSCRIVEKISRTSRESDEGSLGKVGKFEHLHQQVEKVVTHEQKQVEKVVAHEQKKV